MQNARQVSLALEEIAALLEFSGQSSFKVQAYTRCNRCGRPRAVFRRFKLCRICLRELAHDGAIPGMTKSSG